MELKGAREHFSDCSVLFAERKKKAEIVWVKNNKRAIMVQFMRGKKEATKVLWK